MNIVKIALESDHIRLDSLLKLAGAVETGGQAKYAIQSGLVSVNGEPCLQRGKKMRPGDQAVFESICYEVEKAENPTTGIQ